MDTVTVLLYFVSIAPPPGLQDTSLHSFAWHTRPCRMSHNYTLTLLPHLQQAHVRGVLLFSCASWHMLFLLPEMPSSLPAFGWLATRPHPLRLSSTQKPTLSTHTAPGVSRPEKAQCLASPSTSARTARGFNEWFCVHLTCGYLSPLKLGPCSIHLCLSQSRS